MGLQAADGIRRLAEGRKLGENTPGGLSGRKCLGEMSRGKFYGNVRTGELSGSGGTFSNCPECP